MKLESQLPRQGVLFHVAPLMDVVLLLLVFFLLGSRFIINSGVAVDLPESRSTFRALGQLDPLGERSMTHVLTVGAGEEGKLYVDNEEVSLADLPLRLEELRGEHASQARVRLQQGVRSAGERLQKRGQVVIQADELAAYGLVMEVTDLALAHGFHVAYATRTGSVQ